MSEPITAQTGIAVIADSADSAATAATAASAETASMAATIAGAMINSIQLANSQAFAANTHYAL